MKKDNKRKFNIFVSILTCFFITLACLSPSFISRADSSVFDFVTDFNLSDSNNYFSLDSFHNSDVYKSNSFPRIENFEVPFNLSSDDITNIQSAVNGSTSVPIDDVNIDDYFINNSLSSSGIDSSLPNKVCCYHKQNDGFELVFFYLPDNSFVQFNSSGSMFIYSPANNQIPAFVYYTATKGYTVYSFPSSTVTIDDTTYYSYLYITSSQYNRLVTSSVPVYMVDSLDGTSSGHIDYNYSSFNNGGGSSSYSEADILDNLYLGSNNNIYMSGSKVNSSILHILLDFNRNQMEQKNIDTDKFTYDIHMDWIVQGTCTADSKSRQMLNYYFGDGTANWWDNLNGKTYSFDTAFQGSWSGLSCSNVNEISSTIYNDGLYTNGKTATTMANYLSGAVNTGNTVSDTKSFFDSFSDMSILGYSINSMTNSNHTSLTTCYYDVSVDVFYDGEKINDSPITGRCDWLNGSQEMLSNVSSADVSQALANNNNGLPITDPNYKDPNGYKGTIQIVDNSTGGTGGSGGNIESGAIVINNNPTFNNNTSSNSSSFGSNGIIGFILGAIIGNNKSSSDTITSMTGANGWLQVISSTWQWIPSQIWTVLLTTFQAIIGIIIVAFIISIVIRFIT